MVEYQGLGQAWPTLARKIMASTTAMAMAFAVMVLLVGACPGSAWAQEMTPPAEVGEPPEGPAAEGQPADPDETDKAQDTPPPPLPARESFQSPQDMLMNVFFPAMDAGDRARATECLDLSMVDEDRGWDIAAKLWGVLNRWRKLTKWDLPGAAGVRINDLQQFVLYPDEVSSFEPFAERFPAGQIVLVRNAQGEWRFSAETVAQVRDFYAAVADLPVVEGLKDERRINLTLWIRSSVPEVLRSGEVLTLEYWQWLGLFIMALAGMTLDLLVRFFLAAVSTNVLRRRGREATPETVRRMVRPFGLIATAWLWLWAIQLLDLPDDAYYILIVAVKFITMVAAVWAAYRLTDLGGEVLAGKAAQTSTRFDDLLVPLIRKTAKVFITAFGLIYIADALEIDILPLLTGLGIGGLAVAFAAKDTIENFFGSIAVIIDRPFEVGDWVGINDVDGTVEEVGFRSTRIRTFYNSLITVPNATLVRATVDNYGRRRYRRYKANLGLTYDTPPEKVEAFCEGVRELIRIHPFTRKDYYHVYLNNFSSASLDVLLYVFHETPDWSTELRERHRLMLDIMRLADRLGVEFAFPTQTLHLRQESGDEVHTPADPPGARTERAAQRLGRKMVKELTRQAPWRTQMPDPVVIDMCSIDHEEDVDHEGEEPETQIETKTGGEE